MLEDISSDDEADFMLTIGGDIKLPWLKHDKTALEVWGFKLFLKCCDMMNSSGYRVSTFNRRGRLQ